MKKLIKYIFHIDHWLITIFAFIILWILYAMVMNLSFFYPVKRALGNMSATDFFFQITEETSSVNQNITILNLKDEYNRGKIAECISTVDSLKPWIIGVDIIFEGVKGDQEDNLSLFCVANDMKSKAVWSTKLLDYDNKTKSFTNQLNSFFCDTLALQLGFTNLDDNLERKTIRKMLTVEKLNGNSINSFPLELALTLGDSISIKPNNKLTIDYGTKFNTVPYDSIKFHEDLITNHIVLIGSTTDEADMWPTPIGKMSGVALQAYSLNTLRSHSDINYYSFWTNLLIAFILCYLFEIILDLGFQWLRKRDNVASTLLIDSKLLLRAVTIIIMAIITWVILLVFVYRSKYFDAVLILAALGMLIESRRIYNATIKAFLKKYNWWILRNSLYNNNIFK